MSLRLVAFLLVAVSSVYSKLGLDDNEVYSGIKGLFSTFRERNQAVRVASEVQERPFTILSLDGGGVRNIITLKVIEYIENYAYEYGLEKGYIQENP